MIKRIQLQSLLIALLIFSICVLAPSRPATACTFCMAVTRTLSEEINGADVAVIVKLKMPLKDDGEEKGLDDITDDGKQIFEIVKVLRGKEQLKDVKEIEAVYFGARYADKRFLLHGVGGTKIDYTIPIPLSKAAIEYISDICKLPAKGPERLIFFQNYLESADPLLRQDSYDEFANAPNADLVAMGAENMHHDQLIEWIKADSTVPSSRRLYFMMLSCCGQKEDIAFLEDLMQPVKDISLASFDAADAVSMGGLPAVTYRSLVEMNYANKQRKQRDGLDALLACYLNLKGEAGLALLEELFFQNPACDHLSMFSAIKAVRFHGEEVGDIPLDRLKQTLRLVLDNKNFADQVIPDLSRWEDWTLIERFVKMYKGADEQGWVRDPIVAYIVIASEQDGEAGKRGTKALKELEEFDAEGVAHYKTLLAFGALSRARPAPKEGSEKKSEKESASSSPKEKDSKKETPSGEADEEAASKDALEKKSKEKSVEDKIVEKLEPTKTLVPPKRNWLIFGPLTVGLVFAAAFWLILRSPSNQNPDN